MSDPEIAAQAGWLSELRKAGEFTGKLYETVTLHRPAGCEARRLVVAGGGSAAKFSAVESRRLAGVLVRQLKPKGIRTIALALGEGATPDMAQATGRLSIRRWSKDALWRRGRT